MEFKIDTRENFIHITPLVHHLDVNMAAELQKQATQLESAGRKNYLVDLTACQTADEYAFEALASWHETCYSNDCSLVFIGLQPSVLKVAKDAQLDEAINIAPTEIEAVDIISMEIVERDLFGEES